MKRLYWAVPLVLALTLAAYSGPGFYERLHTRSTGATIPVTAVKRGNVIFTVTSKGELQGGNSEVLSAPMTGSGAVAITFLRESGELVKAGDIIVKFDTTEQEFKLREAEADLAETDQQVLQATAESGAKQEEARSALAQAKAELQIAELETRRNELLARIAARQNDLAVAAAKDKVHQLERDFNDRIAAAQAGIAIQEAAKRKALVAAATAKHNIESMTLKAKTSGYVARGQNSEGNFNFGTYLPTLQVGDTVRAGMGVAQIPDLRNWEVSANVGELDRGHLSVGQKADIAVIGVTDQRFSGHVKVIGGTAGPPWDRKFETRLAIDKPSPQLRPGMSVRLVITTEQMNHVLWLPAQALFDSDGRKYVYVSTPDGYSPKDVKLVRRSESRVVVEGLEEGQLVTLAQPDQKKEQRGAGGALQAIKK